MLRAPPDQSVPRWCQVLITLVLHSNECIAIIRSSEKTETGVGNTCEADGSGADGGLPEHS